MVRTYKTSIVSLIIALFCTGCFGPVHTDIDALLEPYSKRTEDFDYIRDCKKPKVFRGISKFRVSCFSANKDKAWEETLNISHSGFFSFIGSKGWISVGSTRGPGYQISKAENNHTIYVFEKITTKENCNRRIYIDATELLENEESGTTKGTQIYIADPRALYCGSARVLKHDPTN